MKTFKRLHKDQLASYVCKFLKLKNEVEVLDAVYSPAQPKNHTTDILVKCKNDNAENICLYVRMNISDKTNAVLNAEILPNVAENYYKDSN